MIAIISSILASIGLGALNPFVPVFVSMDMVISTLCVILMYKWNSYITSKIFCCCMPSPASELSSMTTSEMTATPSTPRMMQNSGDQTMQSDKPSVPQISTSITMVNSKSEYDHDQDGTIVVTAGRNTVIIS